MNSAWVIPIWKWKFILICWYFRFEGASLLIANTQQRLNIQFVSQSIYLLPWTSGHRNQADVSYNQTNWKTKYLNSESRKDKQLFSTSFRLPSHSRLYTTIFVVGCTCEQISCFKSWRDRTEVKHFSFAVHANKWNLAGKSCWYVQG